ncbi:MAG: Ig-like domain-containing protein [Kofleriaceae bacterium]
MGSGWIALVALGLAAAACGGDDTSLADARVAAITTTFDEAPAAQSAEPVARFAFHASEPATFECALDDEALAPCESPVERAVAEGPHVFAVLARGLDGLTAVAPTEHAWVADRTAPETSLASAPASVTRSTTFDFEFESDEPGVTFWCELDGAAAVPCDSLDGVALADGVHTLVVYAVDAAGNADPTPATFTWTIDTSAPDTVITVGAAAITGPVPVTFEFAAVDGDGTETFECAIDAAGATAPTFAACTSPHQVPAQPGGARALSVRAVTAAGTPDPTPAVWGWTVDDATTVTITSGPDDPAADALAVFAFAGELGATFTCEVEGETQPAPCTSPWQVALADGAHTVVVRATDPYGNTASASHGWTIAAIAPAVTIVAGPPAATSATDATFTFTTGGPVATTTCALDLGTPTPCASPLVLAGPLAAGEHTLTVEVATAGGLAIASDAWTWTVDLVAPVVAIDPVPGGVTSDTTPVVVFAVDDALVVTCTLDGTALVPCASPLTLGPLADGTHTLVVSATDAAGNLGSDTLVFDVDTTGPIVEITAGPVTGTSVTTPTFEFTATGADTVTCRVDAGAAAPCASPFTTPSLAVGTHTFTVRGEDAVGNFSEAARTFVVDVTVPVVTLGSGPVGLTNDSTPTVYFTATDTPTPPAFVECRVDGGAWSPCTSPYTAPVLADGPHTLEVRATDLAGNTASQSRSVIVDTVAPSGLAWTGPLPGVSASANAFVFRFAQAVPEPEAIITCRVTAIYAPGQPSTTISPCTTGAVIRGFDYGVTQRMTVTVRDPAGNIGPGLVFDRVFTPGLVAAFPLEGSGDDTGPNGPHLDLDLPIPPGSAYDPAVVDDGVRVPAEVSAASLGLAFASSPDHSVTFGLWELRSEFADGATPRLLWSYATAPGGGSGCELWNTELRCAGEVVALPSLDTGATQPPYVHVTLRTAGTAATSGPVEVFFDGARVATLDVDADAKLFEELAEFTLAAHTAFDELRLYNVALTDEQVCVDLALQAWLGDRCATAPASVDDGLVLYYPLDGDVANHTPDLRYAGLGDLLGGDVVDIGPAMVGTGMTVQGAAVDKTSDAFAASADGSYTFAGWYRRPSAAAEDLLLYVEQADGEACYVGTDGLRCTLLGSAAVATPEGVWSHLAVVVEPGDPDSGLQAGDARIYLDGALAGVLANPGGKPIFGGGVLATVGAAAEPSSLDELRLYDHALTPQVICEQLALRTWDPEAKACGDLLGFTLDANLIWHYRLDGDLHNTAPDTRGSYDLRVDPAPTYQAGVLRQGAVLPDMTAIEDSVGALTSTETYTLTAWIYPTGGEQLIFQNVGTTGCLLTTTRLGCVGLGNVEVELPHDDPDGWVHVLLQVQSSGGVQLWINGNVAGAFDNPGGLEVFGPGQGPATLGEAGVVLDDVRLYDRSFATVVEHCVLADGVVVSDPVPRCDTGGTTALLAYYPLDGDLGNAAAATIGEFDLAGDAFFTPGVIADGAVLSEVKATVGELFERLPDGGYTIEGWASSLTDDALLFEAGCRLTTTHLSCPALGDVALAVPAPMMTWRHYELRVAPGGAPTRNGDVEVFVDGVLVAALPNPDRVQALVGPELTIGDGAVVFDDVRIHGTAASAPGLTPLVSYPLDDDLGWDYVDPGGVAYWALEADTYSPVGGIVDGALAFGGSGVRIPNSKQGLRGRAGYTLMAWVRALAPDILVMGSKSGNGGCDVYIDHLDCGLRGSVRYDAMSFRTDAAQHGVADLAAGEWVHMALRVHAGRTGNQHGDTELFFNGNLTAVLANPGGGTLYTLLEFPWQFGPDVEVDALAIYRGQADLPTQCELADFHRWSPEAWQCDRTF